jgi:hypothetical protein
MLESGLGQQAPRSHRSRVIRPLSWLRHSRHGCSAGPSARFEVDPNKHPHLDYGYAMTSHSSQGETANRMLIHVDTELAAKDLLNNRMAYVSVSRGAFDAQLFTNDREKMPTALGHDLSKHSAHVTEISPEQTIATQQEIAKGPQQDRGIGLGIGFNLPAPDNGSVARAQTLSRPTEGRGYRGRTP